MRSKQKAKNAPQNAPAKRSSIYRPPAEPKKHSFNRPHMIQLPLAAALVEHFGNGAEEVIRKLSDKKYWDRTELQREFGLYDKRLVFITTKRLTLSATIKLDPDVEWRDGNVIITNIQIPAVVESVLPKQPITKLVEHPFLTEPMMIKEIKSIEAKDKPSKKAVVITHHTTTFNHALQLVRSAVS